MSVIAALRSVLVDDPAVSALVDERVHHQRIPEESSLPAVVFFRVSTRPENRLHGASTYHWMRWQFGARASTALQAEEVADAVADALDDYAAASGAVARIRLQGRTDGWDPQLESYADDVDAAVWQRP